MTVHSFFNIILLLYLLSFPVLLEINKRHFKGKNKSFNVVTRRGRAIHPYVGALLIISGAIHGYGKLDGELTLHTGSILLMLLILNGILGFIFKKTRKRNLALLHRSVGVAIVIAFFVHYLKPWLI